MSTLTLSYNDQARSSTTTTTTRGLAAVGTQTFDENGNARLYVQRVNGSAVSTTTTAGTQATTCLGDKNVPTAPKLAPVGPSPNGTFSASIGGTPWTASLGVQATYASPILSVGGGDKRYLVSVGLSVNRGTGEYTTGSIDPDKLRAITMNEEAFKETFARNTVVATLFDTTTKASWQAAPTIGSGTLTLTSISSSGASGTFNLTLEPTPGTGAVGNRTMSGTFNVKF